MAAERIAANLAFINWTVLTSLAVGASAAVAVARTQTDATRGFALFTATCALAFGLLALVSDTALPKAVTGSPVATDPAWDAPRRAALLAFGALTAADVVSLLRRLPVRWLPVAATAAGVTVLAFAALAWGGGGALDAVPLFIQFTVLAAATGGVFAAMVLGHWYLVTPKLSEGPLILFGRLLTAVIAIQLALFIAWVVTGAGPAGNGAFAVLGGPWALFVWLRLIIGLVFPLIVSWAAIQTARSRSMESATGLLYIGVGSVAAGTILAAGLYFGAGVLV